MNLKCIVFTETCEYRGHALVISPQMNFNDYEHWAGKRIHQLQALADSEGHCKSIVVWYEEIADEVS